MTDDETGAKPDDELGDGGKRALVAERKARQDAEKRARDLETRVADFERRDLVREVASAKNVPDALISRLHGDTQADIEKDADELLAALKPATGDATGKPREQLRGGASSEAEPVEDAAAIAAEILK